MSESFERYSSPGSQVVVVAFGSFTNADQDAPSYAFMKSCKAARAISSVQFDAFYFVSEKNDWYHRGARGLEIGVEASAAGLRNLLSGYRRKVFVGNSMGGYGAILFGSLVPADSIIAIAPQTRLDRRYLDQIGEKRWTKALRVLNDDFDGATINLIDRLHGASMPVTIYVGADCVQDLAQARNLAGLPNVQVVEVSGEGHDLAHSLRASGQLTELIAAEVSSG